MLFQFFCAEFYSVGFIDVDILNSVENFKQWFFNLFCTEL